METKVCWFQSWKCKWKRSVSRINKQQLIKSSGNPFMNFSLFTEFSDDGAICIFKYMFTWAVFRRVSKIPKSNYQLRHVCLSLCWFVRPSARNNIPPTGQIFMKFYIDILRKFVEKILQISLKSGKNYKYFTWTPAVVWLYPHNSQTHGTGIYQMRCTAYNVAPEDGLI